ncbi:hypothetical protein [Pseudomonas sp. PAMC 25886]|uniref:hypothetical protein n=1 Tax=Pseudomonas sp. PAMC 25886 TaxID=1125977 RepID=UPI001146FD17|nr:hypothetical protein [Pseudomonas sp. PAMC 25886]
MRSTNVPFFLIACFFCVDAWSQTTMGYYRTCANYNPDYEEVYENSKKNTLVDGVDDLNQYLRESGCRKQIIRAVEIVREQSKSCVVPNYPDYDTYQRGLIGYLKRSEFQSNVTLMGAPIEMVAPDVLRYMLKCFEFK